MNKSYGCENVAGSRCEDCAKREAAGSRCPWCWGGFPTIEPEGEAKASPSSMRSADAERLERLAPLLTFGPDYSRSVAEAVAAYRDAEHLGTATERWLLLAEMRAGLIPWGEYQERSASAPMLAVGSLARFAP